MSNKNQKFYRRNGYLKVKLFNKKEISLLKKKIILDLKKKYFSKFKKNLDLVKLENYHKLNIEEIQHKFLVKPAHRYFLFEKNIFSINFDATSRLGASPVRRCEYNKYNASSLDLVGSLSKVFFII